MACSVESERVSATAHSLAVPAVDAPLCVCVGRSFAGVLQVHARLLTQVERRMQMRSLTQRAADAPNKKWPLRATQVAFEQLLQQVVRTGALVCVYACV